MAFNVKSFRQSVNKSLADLVVEMNAYFTGTPGRVVSVDTSRRISARKSEYLAIRVLYQTGVSAPNYSAYLIQGTTTQSFEDAFVAFATANPNTQIQFIARVEEPQARINIQTQMVIIGTPETSLNYANDPVVVSPTGGIASGASGAATAFNANGVSLGGITVKNIGAGAWTAAQKSVALFDPIAGLYYAVPPS